MALIFIEAGTSATYGFQFYTATSGTITSVSTSGLNILGPRCIQTNWGTAGTARKTDVLADAGRCISFLFRKVDNPSSTVEIARAEQSTAGNVVLKIELTNGGVLRLTSGASSKAGALVLQNNTTYRISLSYKVVNVTADWDAKLYVNGVQEVVAGDTDFALANSASNAFQLGNPTTGGSANLYFAHVAIDDRTDLTDIGNVHVTAKLPAAENANNFEFAVGANPGDRWTNVNERPLSETNGWIHPNESSVQENYTLQSAAEGDCNIDGATILGRTAWIWAGRIVAGDSLRDSGGASNQSKSAGTTLTIATSGFSLGVNLGDTVLIAFAMDGATGTVSCTDNASTPNTYVVDVDVGGSGGTGEVRTCIIRGRFTNITNLTTITITHPSVTARAAVAGLFRGINASSPLDKSAGQADSGASTTPSSGATATTAQNNEVVFGAIGWEGPGADTYTVGTGMTPDQTEINEDGTTGGTDASNCSVAAEYAFQTSASAQTAGGTISSSRDWTACIATYRSSGSGGQLGDPGIVDNGSVTSIAGTLVPTASLHTVTTTNGSYPSNAAGIGMRSNGAVSSAGSILYECGTLIAYIPTPIEEVSGDVAQSRPWPDASNVTVYS